MRLVVVRHAPPAVSGVCYGQSDVPVTIAHDDAAETVVKELGPTPFEAIVSSPFERALGLAKAVARRMGTGEPRVDARLSELSFGEWEGRRFDEIEANDAARFSAWMARYTELAAPGGETVAELDAHAGVVRALRRLRDGTSWEEEMSRAVPYLGVTQVDLGGRR